MDAIYLYAVDTGKISCVVTGDELSLSTTLEHSEVPALRAEHTDGAMDTHYVKDEALQVRPDNPATLSGATLSNLPMPCTIHVNDAAYPCTDTTADLEFDQPGTYSVRVEAWPYLDKEFTVENPAP